MLPHDILLSVGQGALIKSIYQLNTPCMIGEPLKEFARSQTEWHTPVGTDRLKYIPSLIAPDDIINQCPTLSYLRSTFEVASVIIFKMSPFSFYNFHIDSVIDPSIKTAKSCLINLLIQSQRSSLLLATNTPNIRTHFIEHNYQPNTLYVLDAKLPHAIINFEGDRFLMSMRILSPSFEDVVKHCQDNSL